MPKKHNFHWESFPTNVLVQHTETGNELGSKAFTADRQNSNLLVLSSTLTSCMQAVLEGLMELIAGEDGDGTISCWMAAVSAASLSWSSVASMSSKLPA